MSTVYKPFIFKNSNLFSSSPTVTPSQMIRTYLTDMNLTKTLYFSCTYSYIKMDYDKFYNKLKAIAKANTQELFVRYMKESVVAESMNNYILSFEDELFLSCSVVSSLEESVVMEIEVFYNPINEINLKTLGKIERHISKNLAFTEKKPCIYMIVSEPGGYAAKPYNIDENFIYEDLDMHYGEGFESYYSNLRETLKTKTSGFVLFSGENGAGKSYTIKSLVKDLYLYKNFIYVPSAMIGQLNQPEFLSFLSAFCDNMLGCQFVLVLEDSEDVLMVRDQESYNHHVISSILNMTDGILKDAFNTIVICTTNLPVERIDSALLRHGRLLSNKQFGFISKEQYEYFKEKLGIESEYHDEMTISEIYNSYHPDLIDLKKIQPTVETKIGFNVS